MPVSSLCRPCFCRLLLMNYDLVHYSKLRPDGSDDAVITTVNVDVCLCAFVIDVFWWWNGPCCGCRIFGVLEQQVVQSRVAGTNGRFMSNVLTFLVAICGTVRWLLWTTCFCCFVQSFTRRDFCYLDTIFIHRCLVVDVEGVPLRTGIVDEERYGILCKWRKITAESWSCACAYFIEGHKLVVLDSSSRCVVNFSSD